MNINWAKVTAAEVKEHGTRVGDALGPLTQDRFTGWLYDGHMVVNICIDIPST